MGPIRSGRNMNCREPGGPSSAMANEQNNDISNKSKIKSYISERRNIQCR